jgi:hypothetical protein
VAKVPIIRIMDGTELFQSALSPGEHLLWTGQPQKTAPISAGFGYVIIVTFVGKLIQLTWGVNPIPGLLVLELTLLAALLAIAGGYIGRLIYRTWITAYAVTDRRLLMAVGRRRDKLRNVALTDLAPVRIQFVPRAGKMLHFLKLDWTAGTGSAQVWTFIESGEADTWKFPWTPAKPESVLQLIETARAKNAVPGRVVVASWMPSSK